MEMRSRAFILSYLVVFLLSTIITSYAQQPSIYVTGIVTNSAAGDSYDRPGAPGVRVYGYSTEAAAQDAYEAFIEFYRSGTTPNLGLVTETSTDPTGAFSLQMNPNGAIVFFSPDAKAPIIKRVRGQEVINVSMMLNTLDAAQVTASFTGLEAETEAELEGNNLNLRHTVTIPAGYGKTNGRLIFQPYILSADEKDTLQFRRPIVYDGVEYHLTQERRLNFDPASDPLFKYYSDTLSSDVVVVNWRDSIYVEDPSEILHCKSVTRMEDYTSIYFEQEDHIISTDKIRKPLKFLDYNVDTYDLNIDDYYEKPRMEKMPGKANLSIKFAPSEARIDPKDTLGISQLEGLKQTFVNIMNAEGSSLTEFGITATASPEGTYSKNVDLANRRMMYAYNEVQSVIPPSYRKYVVSWQESRVATWIEVAEAMEADSLVSQAQAIRDIVEKYPDSMDAQFAQIRKLDCYRPTIVDYCAKVRSMTCIYESTVYRALTPEEILKNYNDESKGYKTGKNNLTLNEFWNLFKIIEDKEEQLHLYKLAYDQTKKASGKPWVLAANCLAKAYLERDQVDTTILAPFIDLSFPKADYQLRKQDPFGQFEIEIINPRELVANQLVMYLRDNNFRSASVIAQLLPDEEEFKLMKAFTRVLGGYYKGGKTAQIREERRRNFEIARDSSPRNAVVMNLALGYDQYAEEALEEMDPKDPLKAYFRVVIESRRNPRFFTDWNLEGQMIEVLKSAFYSDPTLIPIAASDPDINENIYKSAKIDYDKGIPVMAY